MANELAEELEALQSIYSPEEVDITHPQEGNKPASVTLKVDEQPVVTFLLSAKYPKELPEIKSYGDTDLPLGLKEHLLTELASHFGSSYLYTLVDVAREWLVNRPPLSEKSESKSPSDVTVIVKTKQERTENSSKNTAKMEPVKTSSEVRKDYPAMNSKAEEPSRAVEVTVTPKKTEVCRFYLQKKCKFGSNCRNRHPGWNPNVQLAQPTTTSSTSQISDTSTESVCSEDTAENSDEQTGKKPRLRQAVDVISRILWDPDLQSEDFTIGYLDRFVGIIEKPFLAFSWEDLATVGLNVLAVPKHRIQYFKYRDEIVWDKRSGLDNVFGSKGGKVITDIVSPPTKSTASADSDANNQEASNQAQQTPEAEIKLIEGEDTPVSKASYNDKDRPTHFVCIKIQNAQVLKKVGEILKHISSCAPDLAVGCLDLEALHVTLCMLRIESETQSQAAQEVLRNLQRSFVQILPPSTVLEFTGVGNFHGRLLYAKVAPNQGLSKLVSMLMEQLQNAGVRTPGNFAEYTPHMTLLKLSRPMQREAHTATIVPALYSKFTDMHIGTQKIRSFYLCSTSGPKVDGFYETLMTLPYSFTCLPPSFVSIVLDRISQLANHGVIIPAQKETLTQSLQGDGGKDLDKVVRELEKLKPEKNIPNHSSHVIVLRGVPGSGKSFLSHHCSEFIEDPCQVAICSADDFFTDDTKYAFNTSQLHRAHLHCFDHFLNAILEHKRVIIIDNTNSQLWEYQSFIYISSLFAIPCSVLEVPCLDVRMLEMYRSRCVHNLNHAVSLSMHQRWQKDAQAVIVPPKLSFPGLRKYDAEENKQSFSLLSLCQSQNADILESTEPLVALYTAVFLTQESQWLLLNSFSPVHPEILADHITLAFEPSLKSLQHTKIGKRVKIKVVSSVEDKKIQAAVVVLPRGLSGENQIPHITLSKEYLASSKDSNKLLENKTYIPMKDREMFLEGVIGVAVRKVDDVGTTNPHVVLSNVDYHKLLPRMTVSISGDSLDAVSADRISICTGAHQKVTQLFVFDFDLTLFNSVDPKDGREMYERATGKVWPHRGWLGHPDSLMPPLSVLPGPALADYHDHQGRAGSLTIVLTARIEQTRKAVERILEEAQVYPDEVYFKPDSTSDTETSAQFKVRIIKKLLSENKDVTLVKFWDDKAENLSAVRGMADKFTNIRFTVTDATKIVPMKQDSALYSDLCLRGCHLSTLYSCAATVGVDFLTSQYCRMIGYQGNPKDVCYVFGSFPISRRSDIDMCCLLQSPASPFECIDSFAAQLEECGITYVHKGKSSRCPRLKVKLEFDCAPPVAYDLIFAVVDNDFTMLVTSTNGAQLLSSLRPSDSRSKTALTGPNFLQQVIEAIDGKMSIGEFGMVVEMTAQILRAFRQKGNAYHCIRTFHIVRLLMEFVRSPKFNTLKDSNCDEIFRNFMSSVSEIPPAKWQKLFGDFVPKEYVPRIIDVFATVSHQLSQHPAEKPLPSKVFYMDFNSRPMFPPEGYSTVSLCLHGTSKPLLWKLASLLEARLQTCVRKLLDTGIDVVPDGNDSYEKFCFAVPQADTAKKSFKSSLKHLTDELSDHQQEPLAYLRMHIS